jgi:hypothetical protein
MANISTSIIAFNQADKIEDAIKSVLWTDEIVLADSHSIDGTAEIAERLGARVVQIPLTTFSELRNRAAESCSHEWILSLDADERCTAEVRDEILALLADGPKYDAYYIPRRNFFMGRWIKGSGWYPNYRQPQFYRKGTMRYTRIIHEAVVMQSGQPIGKLDNPLVQFRFRISRRFLQRPIVTRPSARACWRTSRCPCGPPSGMRYGPSSSTTCSSLASAMAGPVSSLRLETSRAPSTAMRSVTKKSKPGSGSRSNRCGSPIAR